MRHTSTARNTHVGGGQAGMVLTQLLAACSSFQGPWPTSLLYHEPSRSPYKRRHRLKQVVVEAWLRGVLAHRQQLCAELLQARGRHWGNCLACKWGLVADGSCTLQGACSCHSTAPLAQPMQPAMYPPPTALQATPQPDAPTKAMTRMTARMRYSFSPLSGNLKAANSFSSSGCGAGRGEEERGREAVDHAQAPSKLDASTHITASSCSMHPASLSHPPTCSTEDSSCGWKRGPPLPPAAAGSLIDSSRSTAMAAYECTTLDSLPSRLQGPGEAVWRWRSAPVDAGQLQMGKQGRSCHHCSRYALI